MGVWNHLENYYNPKSYNPLQDDILLFLNNPNNKEIFIVKHTYNYNYSDFLKYDNNQNLKLMIKRIINQKNIYKNIQDYRGNTLIFNEDYSLIWKNKTKTDIKKSLSN